MDLVNYRNKKHLKHNIKTKIELMTLLSLILTQNPLNSQIYLDPDYGIKITTGDLSNGISYLTDNVIYGVSQRVDIIKLDGEVIKSIPLDIYYGLRNMISAANGRLYIAYTKEIDGLYWGFLY